jgi:predicted ATPase
MLKRLYVHNYKCLVNFEINLNKDTNLFLGDNGSGKSIVFDVLSKIIKLIVTEDKIEKVFNSDNDSPRWISYEKNILQIELEAEINAAIFKYVLKVDLELSFIDDSKIREESLYCNGLPVFKSKEGRTISYTEASDSLVEHAFPFDNSRSGVARCFEINARIFWQYLQKLFFVKINPDAMSSRIDKAESVIKADCSNYAAWFAYLNEKQRREISILEKKLREILPEFDYFRIEQAGQAKTLQVDFENSNKEVITYYFSELSEGQKTLIVLYTLLYCVPENAVVCLDEPENFLALPEIQPWLDDLHQECSEKDIQVLLISHHPKIINLFSSQFGYWFTKENGITQVEKINPDSKTGLTIIEMAEKGWIYEP